MNIHLRIGKRTNLYSIIADLDQYSSGDLNIFIEFMCDGFIRSEIYLFIVAFVNEKRSNGNNIYVELVNEEICDKINYASRVDFFLNLDYGFEEKFKRHNTSGRLIPITNVPPSSYGIGEGVEDVFRGSFRISESDIEFITFIILEMICNTTRHSKTSSGAYYYFQKYQDRLEFILIDNGIGINSSLRENDKYSNLSNEETISKALGWEVTCGDGRGHGFYIMKEVIKKINGNMLLLSGENSIFIDTYGEKVRSNPNWDGVYLKINFKFGASFSFIDFLQEIGYS